MRISGFVVSRINYLFSVGIIDLLSWRSAFVVISQVDQLVQENNVILRQRR